MTYTEMSVNEVQRAKKTTIGFIKTTIEKMQKEFEYICTMNEVPW